MKTYKAATDKDKKLASAGTLDSLKKSMAQFWVRDPESITINSDGSIFLLRDTGEVKTTGCHVKQVVRKKAATGYVFLLPD